MDRRILRLKAHLYEEHHKPWTIEEMAKIADLSHQHFQKLFKAEVGATPISYLKKVRLKQARVLLETTNLRAKEICYKVGMFDESHFSRDFKEEFHAAPSEYRKRHWEYLQVREETGVMS